MTESARPRAAEQPRDKKSSTGGPKAGATFLWVSLIPAFGSCGCSTVRVDRRPSTRDRWSQQRVTRAAYKLLRTAPRRSAIETVSELRTTDALPHNFFGSRKKMLFFVDRLFHRRFYKVAWLLSESHFIIHSQTVPDSPFGARGRCRSSLVWYQALYSVT